MLKVENAIASSFEHFDFVVEAFHEAAGIAIDEVIGNLFQPVFERFDEVIKASQSTLLDTFDPGSKLAFGNRFCDG